MASVDETSRTQLEYEKALANGAEGHLIVDAGDQVAETHWRPVFLRDRLEVANVEGLHGVGDHIALIVRGPGHRIGMLRGGGHVLCGDHRNNVGQQGGCEKLKEMTAARTFRSNASC